MGASTKIAWADDTFNPWVGCTKVSAACDFCYAESWAKRSGHPELWQGERRRTTESNWRGPLKWNREAERSGVRRRVFCASLADVFDNQVPREWRDDLWSLIAQTPHLDWLLLTKRPQNIVGMLPGSCVEQLVGRDLSWPWPNVWLGTTAENQTEADRRIPILLATPAAIRFVSYEPALGSVDFTNVRVQLAGESYMRRSALYAKDSLNRGQPEHKIDWIICGGESGPNARPFDLAWARSVRDQCRAASVPFFMKQIGARPFVSRGKESPDFLLSDLEIDIKDRAGADPAEWPEDLRVQEFPT